MQELYALVLTICSGSVCNEYAIESYTEAGDCLVVAAQMRAAVTQDKMMQFRCELFTAAPSTQQESDAVVQELLSPDSSALLYNYPE